MQILKYLAALWIALIFYAVSSLFAGAAGFSAYGQLNSEKEKQLANLRRLQAINQDIRGKTEALIHDEDTISVYARELGYGNGKEHFIRIAGLDGKQKNRISAGELLLPGVPGGVDDKSLRIASIAIALAIILSFAVVDILHPVKKA
ncbi:MAG: septum formation initiator family protein [Spirochaetaceae bacterium]|jgi:cell division protein FtsB|nr:septum formation initiator family protein [Spirochaetaceae bacterium]